MGGTLVAGRVVMCGDHCSTFTDVSVRGTMIQTEIQQKNQKKSFPDLLCAYLRVDILICCYVTSCSVDLSSVD